MRRTGSMLLVAALLFGLPVLAAERTLRFSPENTHISFLLDATGHEVEGTLYLRDGEIHFDPETGVAGGRVTIDARRTETGNKRRDKTMHAKVLESEVYPLFVFDFQRIEGRLADSGTSEIKIHGTVSIHGAEHPLTLPATVASSAGHIKAESTFPIPYVEWGMHDPSFLILRVAKVVEVTVSTEGDLASDTVAPADPTR